MLTVWFLLLLQIYPIAALLHTPPSGIVLAGQTQPETTTIFPSFFTFPVEAKRGVLIVFSFHVLVQFFRRKYFSRRKNGFYNVIKGTVGKMRLSISKYGSNDTLNIFPPKVSHCRIAQFIDFLIDPFYG